MKKTLILAAVSTTVLLTAGACQPGPPTYEPAEPVGQGEQCFSIERSYPVEEELGVYCLPGVEVRDVQRGGGTALYGPEDDD